jgi:transposase-like protein
MGQTAKELEQQRRAKARLRVIHHYEQVTRNVSRTCRFLGVSRTIFYRWVAVTGKPGLTASETANVCAAPSLHHAPAHRFADPSGGPGT